MIISYRAEFLPNGVVRLADISGQWRGQTEMQISVSLLSQKLGLSAINKQRVTKVICLCGNEVSKEVWLSCIFLKCNIAGYYGRMVRAVADDSPLATGRY